ncbi:MAG: superfamily II DNA helicase RecQ, partial [Paracrocinitomix sp.]
WLQSTMDRPQSQNGVMLSSVHRVKGMEWPRVIVLGADDGALPHRLCDDVEEERRIFHVAITRCQEQVVILADAAQPSPFIAELASEAPPIEKSRRSTEVFPRAKRPTGSKRTARSDSDVAVGDTVAVRGGIEGEVIHRSNTDIAVKTTMGAQMVFPITEISRIVKKATSGVTDAEPLSEADEAIFEVLRAWRSGIATERNVAPYVVFHDSTLRAIARAKPETEQELTAISGIGPAKLENYGDDVLDVVASAL